VNTCIYIINGFLKERLIDLERESSSNPRNEGPLRVWEKASSNIRVTIQQEQESILNIYSFTDEFRNHVNQICDSLTSWKITRQAKLLADIAETKAKNLQKEYRQFG
jgi:hypothetical protein